MKRNLLRIGASLVVMVGILLALVVTPLLFYGATPTAQAQRERPIRLADMLDSRGHPCVSSRLLYILDFGPNGVTGEKPAALGISRPFLPVQVNERQRMHGYLYVTREDIEGVDSFTTLDGVEVRVGRTAAGEPLPIYLENIGMGGAGQPGTAHWMVDHCYQGDPTR
ncbi:MAG TPA: hypothetical protein VFQ92_12545 [Blastocatellia bacterium]|nr:hypothetical protein [Blastocatellia bacterium]